MRQFIRSSVVATVLAAVVMALAGCAAPRPGAAGPDRLLPEQKVSLPGPGLTLSGVLFAPPQGPGSPARHPAIVLLHGCSGMFGSSGQLASNQRAWAERFAQWGYVALTLDSFTPRGATSVCPIPTPQRPARPWEERTPDAYAALAWLARRADVDPQRIFVAGWSHGGSTVMGVVRPEAAGRRAEGPHFRGALAFYPGCARPLAMSGYRTTMPLLILHGEADDWVPAGPCADLARRLAGSGVPVRAVLYPGGHHGFDAPNNRVVFLPDVYTGATGGRGAHVGGHEPSRVQAVREARAYLDGFASAGAPAGAR
ncbi:MAG TPA: dienelactone hydrolase family protein [Burkholderiaceae bacterium]|nr:dienelactone hydrolase family protein [Burkholderiaceae bacterium]